MENTQTCAPGLFVCFVVRGEGWGGSGFLKNAEHITQRQGKDREQGAFLRGLGKRKGE